MYEQDSERPRDEPPRRVAFALRRFALDRKRVLDVGCGDGLHLVHFGPGSMGLELQADSIHLARSRDLDVRSWDFTAGFPEDLVAGFDAVWCSNLIEHVLSAHSFLLQVRMVLRPQGLVLAVVPMTRRLAFGPWKGFLAADHVGFYTPTTIRLTAERAGYEVVFLGSASFPGIPDVIAAGLRCVAPNVLMVARAIEGFDYPEKAHKHLVGDRVVFKA